MAAYLLIDTANAARVLKVTPRRVRAFCQEGRVPGARMLGKSWLIPARVIAGGQLRVRVSAGKRGPKRKKR